MKKTHLIASLGLAAALAGSSFALAAARDDKKNHAPPAAPAVGTPDATPPAAPGGTDKSGKKADAGKKSTSKVGQPAPAFTLKDTSGKNVSLSDFKGKVVVLEWMNPECPVCNGKMKDGSVAKMISAAKESNKDVVFIFINSTASMADKPATSSEYLAANKVTAPALIDGDGAVGHLYDAKTTPHCFVIDDKGVLVYDGAIDDKGSTNYVVNAVKALKEGKAVAPNSTRPYGCNVKYKTS